ncbi:MAG: radical SAM protein [Bacilli bacterium]
MKIKSLCWNITSFCNEHCKFCFREIFPELSLKENKIIAKKLLDYGVEKISFCGGEPLLYKDLFKLINYIKRLNPNIILSINTNGKNINEKNLGYICSKFDWITLPIDASTNKLNKEIGRGINHLKHVLWILEKVKGKNIKIKINTVLMEVNKDDINNINKIIERFKNIKRWKIFRFYATGINAGRNKNLFFINDANFSLLKNKFLLNNKKIISEFNDFDQFKYSYFRIYSNGAYLNESNQEIGNLLDDSMKDVIKKSKECLSLHYLRNKYKK